MQNARINSSFDYSTKAISLANSFSLYERKYIHSLFKSYRRFEALCGLFSGLSLISLIIDYESSLDQVPLNSCSLKDSKTDHFRIPILLTSSASLYLLIYRYIFESKWLNRVLGKSANTSLQYIHSKYQRSRRYQLGFEVLILLIMPIPYTDFLIKIPQYYQGQTISLCYRFETLIFCLSFSRFYFVFRALFNYSVFHNEQAVIFCINNSVNTGFVFAIKCFVKTNPYYMIALLAGITVGFGTFFAKMMERPIDVYSDVFNNFTPNYMWFIFETISTLGYGEYTCLTYGCRVVSVFTWFFGSILVGLLISALQGTSKFTRNESRAFKEAKNSLSAIKLLSVWVKYITSKNRKINFFQLKRLKSKLNNAAQEFKQNRTSIQDYQQKVTNKLQEDLQIIRKQVKSSSRTLNELIKLYE